MKKNMAPKSVAANGDWIWTVMLRAAAIRATPTKETQNACAGIQRGTMFAISAVLVKCSVPNTASGIARNNRPNGMILSSPCVCGSSSLRIFTRPATSSRDPEKYSQKIPLGNRKPASAAARRALAKSTNSKSIPLAANRHH